LGVQPAKEALQVATIILLILGSFAGAYIGDILFRDRPRARDTDLRPRHGELNEHYDLRR
jgi:hypothetical protein